MKKNLIIICNLACLIGFFTGLLGCDQPANEPVTPKIVRKKIRSTPDKKSGPPQRKPATASRPAPKPEPPAPTKQAAEQPALAQKPAPPAPAKPAAEQPVVAQKSAPPAAKPPTEIGPWAIA